MPNRTEGNLHVAGHLTCDSMTLPNNCARDEAIAADAAIDRSKMAQENLKSFPIPLALGRVHDAYASLLPATGGTDDLGLYGGTFGTHTAKLSTGDVKNTTSSPARYARYEVILPPEYVAGETVQIRVKAGMETTVASVSATVDVEAFKSNEEGLVDGADLCTTAAQSINALADAYKDFDITASGLSPGDKLEIRIAVAWNDSATATTVQATIGALKLRCDCKG